MGYIAEACAAIELLLRRTLVRLALLLIMFSMNLFESFVYFTTCMNLSTSEAIKLFNLRKIPVDNIVVDFPIHGKLSKLKLKQLTDVTCFKLTLVENSHITIPK